MRELKDPQKLVLDLRGAGMSRKQIHERTGISEQSIRRYERGERKCTPLPFSVIAKLHKSVMKGA